MFNELSASFYQVLKKTSSSCVFKLKWLNTACEHLKNIWSKYKTFLVHKSNAYKAV